MSARPVKMSRRARKAWLAAGWIVLGTATLTGFALWLNNRRDTDLTDPTSGITADFKEVGSVAKPAIRFLDVAREAGISIRHGPGRGHVVNWQTGGILCKEGSPANRWSWEIPEKRTCCVRATMR